MEVHSNDDDHPTLREFFESRFTTLEQGQTRIETKVDAAVEQGKITNGRVSSLEKFKAQIRAILVLGLLIVPYLLERLLV